MELYYAHPKKSHSIVKKEELKSEYLIDTTECGCCGNKEFRKLLPLYDKPAINYIQCSKCGAVTYDRVYSQKGIDEMYGSE